MTFDEQNTKSDRLDAAIQMELAMFEASRISLENVLKSIPKDESAIKHPVVVVPLEKAQDARGGAKNEIY